MGVDYNPYDPEVLENPYPFYARLRAEAPVYRLQDTDFFAVSRYEDVLQLLRHPELFSSAPIQGVMAGGGMREMHRDPARRGRPPGAMSPEAAESAGGRSLIASDPPEHERLRSIVNRGFTPRRIRALEPRAQQIADRSIDAMLDAREIDLMKALAHELPVTLIAEMLGVEPEHRADFKRWSDSIIELSTGTGELSELARFIPTFQEFGAYFTAAAEDRRRRPRDDLISVLVRAEGGEAELTPREVLNFTALLLVAGNETTTNLIGNTILALLDHPTELARVREDPGLVPGLVEESLRYDSPAQFLFRTAMQDIEIAGEKLHPGQRVIPIFASANRDERRFPDPDRLDVGRDARGHLAFGHGVHFCLGANLARLEARIGLGTFLRRVRRFELAGPVRRLNSVVVRGPAELRLRIG